MIGDPTRRLDQEWDRYQEEAGKDNLQSDRKDPLSLSGCI